MMGWRIGNFAYGAHHPIGLVFSLLIEKAPLGFEIYDH